MIPSVVHRDLSVKVLGCGTPYHSPTVDVSELGADRVLGKRPHCTGFETFNALVLFVCLFHWRVPQLAGLRTWINLKFAVLGAPAILTLHTFKIMQHSGGGEPSSWRGSPGLPCLASEEHSEGQWTHCVNVGPGILMQKWVMWWQGGWGRWQGGWGRWQVKLRHLRGPAAACHFLQTEPGSGWGCRRASPACNHLSVTGAGLPWLPTGQTRVDLGPCRPATRSFPRLPERSRLAPPWRV